MERLIDAAAAEMGIDRLALRRRNQIRPQELPYKTASDVTYDSGDFAALTKQALELADGKGFARRKRESRKRGKLRGLGIGNFLEVTAPPAKELAGIIFNADGTVTLTTGTLDFGMGHATPFAQVLSEQLGIPFEKITLVQGDSDRIVMGGGTGGSKSIMHSGTAIVEAAAKVIEKGKEVASHVLEAAAADIEFQHGRFVIAGTDRSISIMELAQTLRDGGAKLPPDAPQSLDVTHISDGPGAATFPNGCHIAEVEIDPDTGVVEVVEIHLRQRFRHRRQSADRRRPAARRRRAGHRPGADGDDGLRRRRPAAHRLVHGLRHAARGGRAAVRAGRASGAGEDQSARRQGLRRSRLRRRADLGDERGRRRARRSRHPPRRHAADAVSDLAGAARRDGDAGANARCNDAGDFRSGTALRRDARGRAGLRGALPQPLLHDHAGAAVRVRARGLRRELYRSRRWR